MCWGAEAGMRACRSGAAKGVSADGAGAVETNTAANDSEPPSCRPRAPAGPSQTAYTPTEGLPEILSFS